MLQQLDGGRASGLMMVTMRQAGIRRPQLTTLKGSDLPIFHLYIQLDSMKKINHSGLKSSLNENIYMKFSALTYGNKTSCKDFEFNPIWYDFFVEMLLNDRVFAFRFVNWSLVNGNLFCHIAAKL